MKLSRKAISSFAAASAAGIFSTAAAFYVLRYPLAHIDTPISYAHDSLSQLTFVQVMQEEGWYLTSSRLGAPGHMDLSAYPLADNGHFFIMKLLGVFGLTPLVVTNVYFFATFFFTAVCAALALIALGVRPGWASAASVVYALLPYHFYRNVSHIFLSGYYLVPLTAFVLVELARLAILRNFSFRSRRLWLCLGVCAITPAFGVYYAFFFGFLLTATMALQAIGSRSWRPLALGATAAGILAVAAVGNVAPSLFSASMRLAKMSGATRVASETELYGLRLTQMILPSLGYVYRPLQRVANEYYVTAPLITENTSADLGSLACLAFLVFGIFMLAAPFRRRDDVEADNDTLTRLGVLMLLAILYATIGGFSSIFSYLVFPEIRSTNRMIVFIAFFALAGAALLVQRRVRSIPIAVILCLLIAGYAARERRKFTPARDYGTLTADYKNDAAFYAAVEAALPPNARVFNYPHIQFPEGGWTIRDYEHLRGFLHTRNIVWSFGGAKNGDSDVFAQWALSQLETPGWVAAQLRAARFSAVLVNRSLAKFGNPAEASELERQLGQPILVREDGSIAIYRVPEGAQRTGSKPVADVRQPSQVALRMPPSNDLRFHIDDLVESEVVVRIIGWALIEGNDALAGTRRVLFRDSTGLTYSWPIHRKHRPDVGATFAGTRDSDEAGFEAVLPKTSLPAGRYTVGFLLESDGEPCYQFGSHQFVVDADVAGPPLL